jgi:hypothetical protein
VPIACRSRSIGLGAATQAFAAAWAVGEALPLDAGIAEMLGSGD